jgi:hypothetical protein
LQIQIDGTDFKDEHGRTLILRGVNLGGSSKVPSQPDGATHRREGFFDHRDVSFVGRPFPLEEAGEHFARLRRWGFTFLRLLITWEAIEHAGPGVYDQDYLDYLYEVVRLAGEHGMQLFIDPHQDVWSRLSGGDGAPGWTFEAAGLDVTRFSETGAAIVHAIHGDPFPRMIWPTNYHKLAAATMFTLFFGGNDFAPRATVDGEPIQAYLQGHYLAAIGQVAGRLAGLPHVVGYDSMNEPSPGYIGWPDLAVHDHLLRLGLSPTPFQSMLLGDSYPQQVQEWSMGIRGPRKRGEELMNPHGACAWLKGHDCLWRRHGVWDVGDDGQPRLLRPDYFAQIDGRAVDFSQDYLRPFLLRFARAVRALDPKAILFLEGAPRQPPPAWNLGEVPNVVNADHWYDGLSLFTKTYVPSMGIDYDSGQVILGRRRVRRSFARQLARLKAHSRESMGGVPTLLGEFGIPFDLDKKKAFDRGDFGKQIQALDDTFQALEANLLSGTLWNYTADNDNERGDQWNGEDLSIFSRDQQDPALRPGQALEDLDSGGRALQAAVRPYPRAVAGEPLEMKFDPGRREFEFRFRPDPGIEAPTELYVPQYQYPDGYKLFAPNGEYTIDAENQTLIYRPNPGREVHHLRLRPQKGRRRR